MHIVVLITAKTVNESKKIVSTLLDKKQIACANIVPSIDSLFWWQGKIEKEKEVLIVLKSERRQFKAIQKTVKAIHRYSVPEIIALPIIDGNADYLKWIDESLMQEKKK